MATRVWQSTVINAPIGKVWNIVRYLDFLWLPNVSTVELDGQDPKPENNKLLNVGEIKVIYYADKTQQKIRLLELSDQRNQITWEIISSDPPIQVMSIVHSIRLRRVSEKNATFVEWTTDFSKDASEAVIEDARYKQKDNFAGLIAEAAKQHNFHTTAEEALSGVNVAGKVALITGCNAGIGLETARVFFRAGAHVVAAVRDCKKSEVEFEKLRKEHPESKGKLESMSLDLNSLKSVRSFAESFKKKNLPIHYLILNAGIMAIKQRTLTEDGFEAQFGVNHVGHHYLTTLLLDIIKRSAPARIVALSSIGHFRSNILWDDIHLEKKYDKWIAYGQSKTANVLFVRHLNRLLSEANVKVECFAVHPGGIFTGLSQFLTDEDKQMLRERRYRWKTVQEGASTTVVAATSPALEGKGGAYLSDCNIAKTAPHADDLEAAKKLWDITEQLIAKAAP